MTDDDRSSKAAGDGPVTVTALARLAKRDLTTPQLIDLIGHLEFELITRCTPPADWLIHERPHAGRRSAGS